MDKKVPGEPLKPAGPQEAGTPLVQYGPLWNPALEKHFRGGEPPVAVLVCHGMGQQVRFETISSVAEAIRTEAVGKGGVVDPVRVHLAQANDDFLARAELAWVDQDARRHQVHVYEAYWAPLTEDKVSYWDTVKFLLSAAWNGLRYSKLFRKATFDRWMFDGLKTMQIGRATYVGLLGVLLFLLAQVAVIAFASVEISRWVKNISTVHLPSNGFGAWLIFLDSLLPAGTGVLLDWKHFGDGVWWRALAWLMAIGEAFVVRYFLVQYVGDVAAYISPYKDSKFDELRHKIQKIGFNVGKVIYGFNAEDSERKIPAPGQTAPPGTVPRYEKILMVGHSLGSVLAYDTLNGMINLDSVLAGSHRVVERTRALITFGSPLDKTAFLFRVQASRPDVIREQLAASVQPLIVSYPLYRPLTFQWVNIWSPEDIISGELNYLRRGSKRRSASRA